MDHHSLKQGPANFSFKGLDSEYFRLEGPCSLCHNYLLLWASSQLERMYIAVFQKTIVHGTLNHEFCIIFTCQRIFSFFKTFELLTNVKNILSSWIPPKIDSRLNLTRGSQFANPRPKGMPFQVVFPHVLGHNISFTKEVISNFRHCVHEGQRERFQ